MREVLIKVWILTKFQGQLRWNRRTRNKCRLRKNLWFKLKRQYAIHATQFPLSVNSTRNKNRKIKKSTLNHLWAFLRSYTTRRQIWSCLATVKVARNGPSNRLVQLRSAVQASDSETTLSYPRIRNAKNSGGLRRTDVLRKTSMSIIPDRLIITVTLVLIWRCLGAATRNSLTKST